MKNVSINEDLELIDLVITDEIIEFRNLVNH